jgi:hypothetical protein
MTAFTTPIMNVPEGIHCYGRRKKDLCSNKELAKEREHNQKSTTTQQQNLESLPLLGTITQHFLHPFHCIHNPFNESTVKVSSTSMGFVF